MPVNQNEVVEDSGEDGEEQREEVGDEEQEVATNRRDDADRSELGCRPRALPTGK